MVAEFRASHKPYMVIIRQLHCDEVALSVIELMQRHHLTWSVEFYVHRYTKEFDGIHTANSRARVQGRIHLLKSGYRHGALSLALLLIRHTKGALPYSLSVMMRPPASPDATACDAVLSTLFILPYGPTMSYS